MFSRLCQRFWRRQRGTDAPFSAWSHWLVLGFVAQLALIVLVAAVSLDQLQAAHQRLVNLHQEHALRLQLTYAMQASARERTLILARLLRQHDLFDLDTEQQRFHAQGRVFMQARRQLLAMPLSARELELMARKWALIQVALPIQQQIIDLTFAQRYQEAGTVLIHQAIPVQDAVLQTLAEFNELAQQQAAVAWDRAQQAHDAARRWVMTLAATVVGLGLIIALMVVRRTRKMAREHQRLATHDALTGLPNRTLLLDRLEHAILRARRQGERIGVLFLDLNGFKTVNDRLGHAAGDELLLATARRLQAVVRANDVVARLGGDEFILVLEDADSRQHIEHVGRKLLDAVAQPLRIAGETVQLTGSIGICLFPDDGDHAKALLHCADFAMYAAKRSGNGTLRHHAATPAGADLAR